MSQGTDTVAGRFAGKTAIVTGRARGSAGLPCCGWLVRARPWSQRTFPVRGWTS